MQEFSFKGFKASEVHPYTQDEVEEEVIKESENYDNDEFEY
jgi:hypothetical protein